MTKLLLFDVEGTTTDISFVHKVLFPYAAKNLPAFLLQHHGEQAVARAIAEVRETVKTEEGQELRTLEDVTATLLTWIKDDRKHRALKEIQGHIWDIGYSKNHFKGHVYPDVEPAFRRIVGQGSRIGIYSSGSIHAQKLIFGYSECGDLTPLISYYYDTGVGAKRDPLSYRTISDRVAISPSDIHFFSDVPEELAAAKAAGLEVSQVLRPGTKTSHFEAIHDFTGLP